MLKDSQLKDLYKKALNYFNKGNIGLSIDCLEECIKADIYYLKKLFYDKKYNSLKESREFKALVSPQEVFKINDFITLKLIFSKTLIYICEDLFLTCQKVAINITPTDCEEYKSFDNIDDIIDFYGSNTLLKENIQISPEEEFWAHCSNLQTWVENDYNSCLLTKNVSFPIIAELSKKGFTLFTTLLKRELICRLKKGGEKELIFFMATTDDNYLLYLSEGDLFDNLLSAEDAKIMKRISKFSSLDYTLTPNLKDSRQSASWRVKGKLHFCIKNGHVSELEILISKDLFSSQYRKALLQLKNLKHITELALHEPYNINEMHYGSRYLSSLYILHNLEAELSSIFLS